MIPGPHYGKEVSVVFENDDAKKKSESFLKKRFKVFFPEHNQCTLIGSTSLYMTKTATGKHHVLDGFHFSSPYFSEDFKDLTLTAAIADGLGYDEKNEDFNQSLAAVATALTQAVVNVPFEDLPKVARTVQEQLPPNIGLYRPTCSFADMTLCYRDGAWKAKMRNIGDGMIVIFNTDSFTVKHVMPAVVKHRARGNYSPDSAQDLFSSKSKVNFESLNLDLEQDDVVILMTDGAYSGFHLTTKPSAETEESWHTPYPVSQSTFVQNQAFEKMLAQLKHQDTISAFDIAHQLLVNQTESFLAQFHLAQQILKQLQLYRKINPETMDLTLSSFLTTLSQDDLTFYASLKSYLEEGGHHDGVQFNVEKATVKDLINVLSTQEFGDCATISVIRVPNYNEELIKKYLDNEDPELLKAILNKMSAPEIKKVFNSLSTQNFHSITPDSSGISLGKISPSQYSSKTLKKYEKQFLDYFEKGFTAGAEILQDRVKTKFTK